MKKIKFTVHGFQQEKLISLNLDNDDALILKVLKDSYSSVEFEHIIENNDRYIWISYTALLNYIPIIGSRAKLMRRIKYFSEIGLIDRVLKNNKSNTKGNFAYVKPTKKLDLLTEYNICNDTPLSQNEITLSQNETTPLSQNEITLVSKRDNKDSINKDSINKKDSKNYDEKIIVMDQEQEKYINQLKTIKDYPLDLGKDLSYYNNLLEKYPAVDLVKMIEDYAIYKLDNPLTKKCNPRSQINTQCKKCIEWNKNIRKKETQTKSKEGEWQGYENHDYGF